MPLPKSSNVAGEMLHMLAALRNMLDLLLPILEVQGETQQDNEEQKNNEENNNNASNNSSDEIVVSQMDSFQGCYSPLSDSQMGMDVHEVDSNADTEIYDLDNENDDAAADNSGPSVSGSSSESSSETEESGSDHSHDEAQAPARKRQRTVWVKCWIESRPRLGQFDSLLHELGVKDGAAFRKFLRVSWEFFNYILGRIHPRIVKKNTNWRESVKTDIRLAVTLRFLTSGESYSSLHYQFRLGHSTIAKIVPQVCKAIIAEFEDEVLVCPDTVQEWQAISDQWFAATSFPHVCAAVDGTHIPIHQPRHGGSEFYNYKGFHSIVMLAFVDSNCRFLYVDVNACGSSSDAQIFNYSEFNDKLEDGTINFPKPSPLLPGEEPIPYFLIGDDAFALKTYMQKPYSRRSEDLKEKIFNFRLSRARRLVENAFGIMKMKFQCLRKIMQQKPGTCRIIAYCCCCLHNLLRMRYPTEHAGDFDRYDDDGVLVRANWRNNPPDVDVNGSMHCDNLTGKTLRDKLADYFSDKDRGWVPWQEHIQ